MISRAKADCCGIFISSRLRQIMGIYKASALVGIISKVSGHLRDLEVRGHSRKRFKGAAVRQFILSTSKRLRTDPAIHAHRVRFVNGSLAYKCKISNERHSRPFKIRARGYGRTFTTVMTHCCSTSCALITRSNEKMTHGCNSSIEISGMAVGSQVLGALSRSLAIG